MSFAAGPLTNILGTTLGRIAEHAGPAMQKTYQCDTCGGHVGSGHVMLDKNKAFVHHARCRQCGMPKQINWTRPDSAATAMLLSTPEGVKLLKSHAAAHGLSGKGFKDTVLPYGLHLLTEYGLPALTNMGDVDKLKEIGLNALTNEGPKLINGAINHGPALVSSAYDKIAQQFAKLQNRGVAGGAIDSSDDDSSDDSSEESSDESGSGISDDSSSEDDSDDEPEETGGEIGDKEDKKKFKEAAKKKGLSKEETNKKWEARVAKHQKTKEAKENAKKKQGTKDEIRKVGSDVKDELVKLREELKKEREEMKREKAAIQDELKRERQKVADELRREREELKKLKEELKKKEEPKVEKKKEEPKKEEPKEEEPDEDKIKAGLELLKTEFTTHYKKDGKSEQTIQKKWKRKLPDIKDKLEGILEEDPDADIELEFEDGGSLSGGSLWGAGGLLADSDAEDSGDLKESDDDDILSGSDESVVETGDGLKDKKKRSFKKEEPKKSSKTSKKTEGAKHSPTPESEKGQRKYLDYIDKKLQGGMKRKEAIARWNKKHSKKNKNK